MANPHTLSWANPTARTDGSVYDFATENAGYEIAFDGAAAAGIPLASGTTFDMASLVAYTALKHGPHNVTLAAVDKGGLVSAPSVAATFSVAFAPTAPTALGVA